MSAFGGKADISRQFCCGASEIHVIRVTRAGIVNYLVAPSPEHLSVTYVVWLIVSARRRQTMPTYTFRLWMTVAELRAILGLDCPIPKQLMVMLVMLRSSLWIIAKRPLDL